MSPVIALVLAHLPAIIQSGATVVSFVREQRKVMLQRNEWSEEHEREFTALLTAAGKAPHWQPEPS